MEKKDETLTCKDCGAEFQFTVREQEFYAEKGFTNKPVRCKECRDKKKAQHNNGRSFGNRNNRFNNRAA